MSESPALLRFGSCIGRLFSDRPEYTEAVATVFGADVHAWAEAAGHRHFDLRITDREPERPTDGLPDPGQGMVLGGTSSRPLIVTQAVLASLELDARPVQIRIGSRPAEVSWFELRVHLDVVLNKILLLMDRIVLHAAAVGQDGAANLFVGAKGAGKSTVTLALARAGGTVLGEDRAILWRTGDRFLVSGADERSRVTEQTERHFFPDALAVPAQDFAGTLKKEIRMGDYFCSRPYEDFPVRRLFFPRVTGTLALHRLSAQQALLALMKFSSSFQRFAGPADQARFLDLLAGFIATVPSYDLELSEDLQELDRLAPLLDLA